MPVSSTTTLAIAGAAYARGADPAIPWLRIVLAFIFCIAVAVGAILWLRARQGVPIDLRGLADRLVAPRTPPAPRALEVEERLRISPSGQIMLLRCGTRRYLIHVGPQGAQQIDRLDDGEKDGSDRDGGDREGDGGGDADGARA